MRRRPPCSTQGRTSRHLKDPRRPKPGPENPRRGGWARGVMGHLTCAKTSLARVTSHQFESKPQGIAMFTKSVLLAVSLIACIGSVVGHSVVNPLPGVRSLPVRTMLILVPNLDEAPCLCNADIPNAPAFSKSCAGGGYVGMIVQEVKEKDATCSDACQPQDSSPCEAEVKVTVTVQSGCGVRGLTGPTISGCQDILPGQTFAFNFTWTAQCNTTGHPSPSSVVLSGGACGSGTPNDLVYSPSLICAECRR